MVERGLKEPCGIKGAIEECPAQHEKEPDAPDPRPKDGFLNDEGDQWDEAHDPENEEGRILEVGTKEKSSAQRETTEDYPQD